MKNTLTLLIVGIFILSVSLAYGHGDHSVPGALPPAPHGGIIKEADHAGKDEHEGKEEETELFFEAVYKNMSISLYPLTILPNNTNMFKGLSASKDLSKVNLKIEIPRLKKTESVQVKILEDSITASFDPKKANRFIIHVTAEYQKEVKTAKIQVENN